MNERFVKESNAYPPPSRDDSLCGLSPIVLQENLDPTFLWFLKNLKTHINSDYVQTMFRLCSIYNIMPPYFILFLFFRKY